MNRMRCDVFAVAMVFCGLIFTSPTEVAALTKVPRSEWAGGLNLPSYVTMQVFVPSKLAAKPPIVVANHACASPVSGQETANAKIKAAADKNGFIMIFPDNQLTESGGSTGQNCWDVGSPNALKHDGLSDPHAIAQMVRYALKKYNGDSSRVYVLGGSSGAMMTQALLAIYPEIFVAGSPRAGVPCGCWAENFNSGKQWSDPCANGTVSKTAQQWGDLVRGINPNYTGHRPRVQIFHGESDQTIKFPNFNEGIKQWTNVLGLNTTPDSTDKVSKSSTIGYEYNRKFWKNKCGYVVLEAWSAPSQPHSMNYEEDAILKFFGLDVAGGMDPELAKCNGTAIGKANRISIGVTHKNFFNEQALVLNSIQADEVIVKIMNTTGQVQYNGKHKLISTDGSLSIPLSFLKTGYYISSVACIKNGKSVNSFNLRFVLVK